MATSVTYVNWEPFDDYQGFGRTPFGDPSSDKDALEYGRGFGDPTTDYTENEDD